MALRSFESWTQIKEDLSTPEPVAEVVEPTPEEPMTELWVSVTKAQHARWQELDALVMSELKVKAKAAGVPKVSGLKKPYLITAIIEAEAAKRQFTVKPEGNGKSVRDEIARPTSRWPRPSRKRLRHRRSQRN